MNAKIESHTLGCKVNFADTEAIVERLEAGGDRPVSVIGTCCVTAEGEKQSRKEVRRALRRAGDGGRVFVTGCAARLNGEAFRELGDNVEVLVGEPEVVAGAINASLGVVEKDLTRATVTPARSRCFLKVQDGCARQCSYCVIPQVRGEPRSMPMAEVLKLARRRVAAGYQELVVNGINVGAWRDGSRRLPELLAGLAGLEGVRRLRLSSIELAHVSEDLLGVMRRQENIGRHLHIPLQSGDERVLAAMRRRYDGAAFMERVVMARELLPGVNITTDVIAGFPGEDEAAFSRTMELIGEAGFSRVHVFPYSVRPGAAAASLDDVVPAIEKRRRARLLRELSERQSLAHRQRKVGGASEVLLELRLVGGYHGGYSLDYTRFEVRGALPGAMVRVLAVAAGGKAVRGEVLS